jgi:pectate lyase
MSDENTAEMVERGNEFVDTSGDILTRGSAFQASDYYSYTMDPAAQIKDIVMASAGRR